MITRVATVFLTIVSAGPLAAQEQKAITVSEWRQEFETTQVDDSVALTKLATRFAGESATLMRLGNRTEAQKRGLMTLVLMKHVHTLVRHEGRSVPAASLESIHDFESVLIKNGLTATVIEQSALNLQAVTASAPMRDMGDSRTARRAATVAERAAMIDVIKASLYDPTMPIFGRSDISGNLACFTVNARNRLGALTGNQEAVLYFDRATKSWKGGEIVSVSHDVCLNMADNAGG